VYVHLFLRSLSQALQAFAPLALSLTWFDRAGFSRTSAAIRRGLIVSIPTTILASPLFQRSIHRALDEALLAAVTVAVTSIFAPMVWRAAFSSDVVATDRSSAALWVVTILAVLIVMRQTMEIGAVLEAAAIELRSFDATMAIVGGLIIGGCIALSVRWLSLRLPDRELAAATRAFVAIFFVQGVIYAFHEFTEARLLPASDALHAATEPYGPDGTYGVHLTDLLVICPLVAAGLTFVRSHARLGERLGFLSPRRVAIIGLSIASFALIGLQRTDAARLRDRSNASQANIPVIDGRPHLLFVDTSPTADFGMLSLAPLDAPETRRISTKLSCERASFAAGHGLCLHTTPGIFVKQTAAVLDGKLRSTGSIKLEGRPSRTRTSADGRIGAITVFVLGDNYAAKFSTRTTLIDMSNGDVIGELEQFSTWRNGARFHAVDFNFWGVTFATDDNTFYVSLGTSGSTYLVRGDLALRKLTVIRENVECPSLSPDNRLIAFKKHPGPGADEWRLAILDLKTMTERLISAETRSIDDQVEWLDAGHVLYAVPRRPTSISDVWVAPIDGSTPARLFLSQAESPIVVR
jgi:hypothetical protein